MTLRTVLAAAAIAAATVVAAGCGGGAFCPDAAVTRAQMAVLLVNAFHL